MGVIRFLILAVVTVLLVIFCAYNRTLLSFDLFPFPYVVELPLFVFAIGCIAIGVVLGGVSSTRKLLKIKHKLRKTSQQMQAMDNEIKALRSERNNNITAISNQPNKQP